MCEIRDVQLLKCAVHYFKICAKKLLRKTALDANRSVCHRINMSQLPKKRFKKDIDIKIVQEMMIQMTGEKVCTKRIKKTQSCLTIFIKL